MFIAHYGIGLAAKNAAPAISLGLFFLAVQFPDLLWPTLLLLEIEHVEIVTDPAAPIPFNFTDYPISHSLVMVLVWSLLFGVVHWLFRRNKRNALILGLCVFSHWILDFIVHLPDLPLYPGNNAPKFGLELWRYKSVTLVVETIIFLLGCILYLRTTRPKNKVGSVGFWILILLLAGSHIANIFSPTPSSVTAVAYAGQLMWLFVILAFWVDKNREHRLKAVQKMNISAYQAPTV